MTMTFFIGIKVDLKSFCNEVEPPFLKEPQERQHITILYLGKTRLPEYLFKELSAFLLSFKPFRIVLKGAISIPSISKPRVIAAKVVDGEEKLKELHRALLSFCYEHKIKIYNRYVESFLPHATFARYRGKDYVYASKIAERILKRCERIAVSVIVKKLVLYEAIDQYIKLAVFPLRKI